MPIQLRFPDALEPTGDKMVLNLHGEISGGGWMMSLIGKFFVGPMKKAITKDLNAMKPYVEKT